MLFNLDTPWCTPEHNMLNNLLWAACGTDIVMTVSDGRVVYRDGEWPTIDVEKAKAEAERVKNRILSQM